jgi:hypothetical protein
MKKLFGGGAVALSMALAIAGCGGNAASTHHSTVAATRPSTTVQPSAQNLGPQVQPGQDPVPQSQITQPGTTTQQPGTTTQCPPGYPQIDCQADQAVAQAHLLNPNALPGQDPYYTNTYPTQPAPCTTLNQRLAGQCQEQ